MKEIPGIEESELDGYLRSCDGHEAVGGKSIALGIMTVRDLIAEIRAHRARARGARGKR